jgi:hypothetical protein
MREACCARMMLSLVGRRKVLCFSISGWRCSEAMVAHFTGLDALGRDGSLGVVVGIGFEVV